MKRALALAALLLMAAAMAPALAAPPPTPPTVSMSQVNTAAQSVTGKVLTASFAARGAQLLGMNKETIATQTARGPSFVGSGYNQQLGQTVATKDGGSVIIVDKDAQLARRGGGTSNLEAAYAKPVDGDIIGEPAAIIGIDRVLS